MDFTVGYARVLLEIIYRSSGAVIDKEGVVSLGGVRWRAR